MDLSRRSISPTPSDSSVEIIVTPSSSRAPSHCSQVSTTRQPEASSRASRTLRSANDNVEVAHQTGGASRRWMKRRVRLAMRLDPAELAAYDKRKIEWSQLKEAMARLRKDACMKRELKRAMKTKISPPSFQVIDDDDFLTEEGSHRALSNSTLGTGNGLDYDVFAGQITIRDHLGAMRQALSEHSKDGPRRKEPGRHSFHVDAAVSRKHDLTGIGVVFKTHRQNWASLWTVRGYQIGKKLDQNDAELWAIWQALEIVLKRVNGDSGYQLPSDPCSLAVIYTDSQEALRQIGSPIQTGGVAQRIRNQARELQELGVNVQLHWVPGHRRIPGNELADRLSKEATFHPSVLQANTIRKPQLTTHDAHTW